MQKGMKGIKFHIIPIWSQNFAPGPIDKIKENHISRNQKWEITSRRWEGCTLGLVLGLVLWMALWLTPESHNQKWNQLRRNMDERCFWNKFNKKKFAPRLFQPPLLPLILLCIIILKKNSSDAGGGFFIHNCKRDRNSVSRPGVHSRPTPHHLGGFHTVVMEQNRIDRFLGSLQKNTNSGSTNLTCRAMDEISLPIVPIRASFNDPPPVVALNAEKKQ